MEKNNLVFNMYRKIRENVSLKQLETSYLKAYKLNEDVDLRELDDVKLAEFYASVKKRAEGAKDEEAAEVAKLLRILEEEMRGRGLNKPELQQIPAKGKATEGPEKVVETEAVVKKSVSEEKVNEQEGEEKVLATLSDEQAAKQLASDKNGTAVQDPETKLWRVIIKEGVLVDESLGKELDKKAVYDFYQDRLEDGKGKEWAEEQTAKKFNMAVGDFDNIIKEGKEVRGQRDGTGPYKDSAMAGKEGIRKQRGEECPKEAKVNIPLLINKLDQEAVGYFSKVKISPTLEDRYEHIANELKEELGISYEDAYIHVEKQLGNLEENVEIVVSEEGDPKAVVTVDDKTDEVEAEVLEPKEDAKDSDNDEDEDNDEDIDEGKQPKDLDDSPETIKSLQEAEGETIYGKAVRLLDAAYSDINEPVEGQQLEYRNQLVLLCEKVARETEATDFNPYPIEPGKPKSTIIFFDVYNALLIAYSQFGSVQTEKDKKAVNDIVLLCENISHDAERMDESKLDEEKEVVSMDPDGIETFWKIPEGVAYVNVNTDAGQLVTFYTKEEYKKATANVDEAKEPPMCKKCGTKHWPFNKCGEKKHFQEEQEGEEKKEKLELESKINEDADDFTLGYAEALRKSLKDVLGVDTDQTRISARLKSMERPELEELKVAMERGDTEALKGFLNTLLV